ncbi:MAG: DUF2239 family protein [Acidobacteria bacterium]|nr:MAG: DUF2239 family protein [Acidobacteriota bacterium]
MIQQPEKHLIAFAGTTRLATGSVREVVRAAKAVVDRGDPVPILIFDAVTSEPMDVDFRGSPEEVLSRLPRQDDVQKEAPRSAGRPKLGVIAREVTLLPRHWEWLAGQPGGASVTLRKLVEQARRSSGEADRVRVARERTYRFMSAMAGDAAGFEEGARALFSGNRERFEQMVESWPADVREHTRELAKEAFAASEQD